MCLWICVFVFVLVYLYLCVSTSLDQENNQGDQVCPVAPYRSNHIGIRPRFSPSILYLLIATGFQFSTCNSWKYWAIQFLLLHKNEADETELKKVPIVERKKVHIWTQCYLIANCVQKTVPLCPAADSTGLHKGTPHRKKSISFGHCPNYLSPLLPTIRVSCTTILDVKNDI